MRLINLPGTATSFAWNSNSGATFDSTHTTITCAYSSNVTAGNLLIVWIDTDGSRTVSAISDTLANTWNAVSGSPAATGNHHGYMYWAIANSSGATTVSITVSAANNCLLEVGEWAISNTPLGASPTDGAGTNGATTTSLTVTTTAASGSADLVIAGFLAANGHLSTPSGYTSRVADSLGGGPFAAIFDKTATSSGAQSATAGQNTSGDMAGVVVNFIPTQPGTPNAIICGAA